MAIQVEDYEELKDYYNKLQEYYEVDQLRTVDHSMTKSIYITDPDGNGIELFCNTFEQAEEGLAEMRRPRSPEHRAGLRLDPTADTNWDHWGRTLCAPMFVCRVSVCNRNSDIRIRAAALDLDGTIIGPDEMITPACGMQSYACRREFRCSSPPGGSRRTSSTTPANWTWPAPSCPTAARPSWTPCRNGTSGAPTSAGAGPGGARTGEELGARFVATHVEGTFRRLADIPTGISYASPPWT